METLEIETENQRFLLEHLLGRSFRGSSLYSDGLLLSSSLCGGGDLGSFHSRDGDLGNFRSRGLLERVVSDVRNSSAGSYPACGLIVAPTVVQFPGVGI